MYKINETKTDESQLSHSSDSASDMSLEEIYAVSGGGDSLGTVIDNGWKAFLGIFGIKH